MKKLDNHGFSAVETLLSIIVVLLIVFVGYYVWHSQHQTNKTYSAAGKTAQSSPPKTTNANSGNFLAIKEWGVEAPYSGSLSLSYALGDGSDSNSAAFSSKELTAASVDCLGRGGTITRYTSDADATNLGGDGQTVAQYAASADKTTYAHVGNYYYFFTHDQAACGDNPDATQALQQQTNDAVKALVPKLKSITN